MPDSCSPAAYLVTSLARFLAAFFAAPLRLSRAASSRGVPARLGALACCGALLLLTAFAPHAQPADTDTTLDTLRKQVDSAQQSLKDTDKLDDAQLQRLRTSITAVQAQSSGIADQLQPQLAGIEARVAELGTPVPGAKEDADVASQRTLLNKNRSQLDAQVKLARLIAVEAEQLAAQMWELRRSQFQARLGERTNSILATPFWAELRDDLARDSQRLGVLGRGLKASTSAAPMGLLLAAPFALAAVWWLLRWLHRRLMERLTTRVPAGRLRRSLYALAIVVRATLVGGALALMLYAVVDWDRSLPEATESLLSRFSGMLWFGGFMFGLATALISAKRPSWRLMPLPDPVATALRWFPHQLTLVSLLSWLAERLAGLVNASLSMAVAINCLVALALSLTVALALMRADRVWRVELAREEGKKTRPLWLVVVVGANWLILATAIVSLLAGYVAFGSFAVKQVVWAMIVLGTAYLIAALIDDALMAWLGNERQAEREDGPAPNAAEALNAAQPVKNYAQLAVLLSGLLRLSLLLFALMLLLAPFGEGPSDLLRRSGQWQQGIDIGEVKLQPAAVMQALLVLVLGLAAVRWLRGWLSERYLPTTSLDPGMRSSATSLFGYAGVVVAVSLAMSAMGIGLERIAWVASALSVGIGFGLQAVVQNFVSGLILLAERPVKVGDWVSLGGVEGDIRRINVRATEIQMGDRSTVIVPNSEFITKVVRNVTLADPIGLVQVKLPVPLGSDAQQVRELLLQAFDANPDVLDTPAPAVLLDGVDGHALLFNATGFVKSPRMAGAVRSALLFDALSRLKTAGITLSPQPTMLINAPSAPAPLPGSPSASSPGPEI
jgi:potassium-dependent mechanosensitive channel